MKHRSLLVLLIISMELLKSDPLRYEAMSPGSHTWPENVSYSSLRDLFIYFFVHITFSCNSTLSLYVIDMPLYAVVVESHKFTLIIGPESLRSTVLYTLVH